MQRRPNSSRRANGRRIRSRSWGDRRRKLNIELLEARCLLASDWQNPLAAPDVDDDSSISPLDVLILINEINRNGARPLNQSINLQSPSVAYLDVDGDRSLSPLDVLSVINTINRGVTGAGLSLSLVNDRGSSASDRITNDPRVKGTVTLNSASITNARARINQGDTFQIDPLPDGSLVIDLRRFQSISDGSLRIAVAIDKSDGTTSLNQLRFTYDATPPRFIAPRLVAEDDTGRSDQDGSTRINNPRVELFAESDSHLTVEFQGNVLHDAPSTGVWTTQLAFLNDGTYEMFARASDLAGNVSQSPFPFLITIDTVAPGPLSLDLAPSSDTGIRGDRQTDAGRVTLLGSTEPNARVTLDNPAIHPMAASDGKVRVPSVSLQNGDNTFEVFVEDLSGNQSPKATSSFQRTTSSNMSDPVDHWMRISLDAIRSDATDPPMATRGLAMLSMTMLEITQALDGLPSRMVQVASPPLFSTEAAIARGAFHVLSYLYPAQTERLARERDQVLDAIPEGQEKQNGITFGQSIAEAIVLLRSSDGWDAFEAYEGKQLAGYWVPTEPMYAVAMRPRWPELEPWSVSSIEALRPDGPPDMSSREYSRDFDEVKALGGATSTIRTSEQTSIATFWSNGPGTATPPGQWNSIALDVADSTGASLGEKARLFATLNVSLADAAIASWDTKYHYEFWRPVTAIHLADQDENSATTTDATWRPLLITPPFPEYVSGHSTFSATAASILTKEFGEGFSFTTGSDSLPNVLRSYPNFVSAAQEAGRSRIYGGIHYEFSNRDGQQLGQNVAREVWNDFASDADTKAPVIRITSPSPQLATATIPTLRGRVVDNWSGVRGLQASVDGQAYVRLTLDALGQFEFVPQLEASIPVAGSHTVRFQAIDLAGNLSTDTLFTFTLDDQAPSIDWQSPSNNADVPPTGALIGVLNGTGSDLVAMSYQIDGGTPNPIRIDPTTGRFEQRIDWSRTEPGNHAITISIEDAAGNRSTTTRAVRLTERVPLAIASSIPASGAVDVGTTLRPRIFFSRPIQASTLNALNLFATGPDGEKLPGNIVPATDGSFAWLFLDNPMPSGARVTIHVDGETILSADGARLDADGNGAAGGRGAISFQTVSLAPLVGTSLTGRIVDPGIDLLPMTWDDIRSGADRTLHTADDVFLNPIAGVQVYILGMEGNRVTTDAQGRFHLDRVPAGNLKLAIDGRTATNAPAGFFFPEMVMDLNLRAGQVNTVMGSMGTLDQQLSNADRSEVYLPRLSTTMLQDLSPTVATRIEVSAKDAPDMTPEQRSRLSLTVPPGIAVDHHGAPVTGGQIGISTVPPELVRDMLPPGLLQHTFDITIQAPGIDRFTSPIPMTFPNLAGAAPGTSLQFLSFDHTTGRLVIEGTGTVSADGSTISTDPGNGITHPGWHGWIQESNDTGDYDDSSQECSFDSSGGSGNGEGEDACDNLIDPIPYFPDMENRFFVDDKDEFDLRFGNRAIPLGSGVRPLVVELTLDDEALQFLDGLESQTFELESLKTKTLRVKVTDKLDALRFFDRDEFWGARLHVKAYPKGKPQEVLWDQTNYIYRYVDALDAVTPERAVDGILDFPDVLADGVQGVLRTRPVSYYMPTAIRPTFAIENINFYVDGNDQFIFDPSAVMNGHKGQIDLRAPDGNYVASLRVRGDGTPKFKLDINKQELKSVLALIVADAASPGGDANPILFTPDERALLATDELREAFVNDLAIEMIKRFDQVSQGVEIGTGENSVDYRWSGEQGRTLFGNSGAPNGSTPEEILKWDGVDIGHGDGIKSNSTNDLNTFLLNVFSKSPAVQAFMLSDLLNQSFQTKVSVFPDNVIEAGKTLNSTRQQMLNSIAKIAVHEAGHTFGLIHTAQQTQPETRIRETQLVTLSNGSVGDTFTLSFNGATTAPIRFDAEAADIDTALTSLPTIGFNSLTSSPGRGGPFTITFSGVLAGFDVPLLTSAATGSLQVNVTTLVEGSASTALITTPNGTSDIMFGGFLDPEGQLRFQPGISLDALKVGLHLAWTTENSKNVIDRIASHLAANNGRFFDGHLGDHDDHDHPGESEHGDESGSMYGWEGVAIEGVAIAGPRLYVADVTNQVAWSGLDFGTQTVDGTGGNRSSNPLTLRSFGSLPIIVHSVDLESSTGAFSLSDFEPGTTIAVGEEREITVYFDPLSSGEHEAWIVLMSNDENLPTRIPLRGVGKSPNADLLLDVPNNNIGGTRAGFSNTKSDAVTLRNPGSKPLTITDVRFRKGEEFGVSGLPAGFGPSAPIILQPSESISLDVQFAAGANGLRRDVLEVTSNDPLKPLVAKTFVGTGVTTTSSSQLEGNDYVAVELLENEGAPILRQRSDNAGRWSFTLPINTMIRHMVFDPSSALISHGFDLTGSMLERTQVTSPVFRASTQNDRDEDGLPDDIERAIGTGVRNTDSDNDGIDDWVEFQQGADPLGGRGLPLGVVAAASMQGTAMDVVVGTNPQDPSKPYAYVATGFHGLAILDISNANQPVLISELNLSGRNLAIDVDISSGLAVLAAEGPGIHFVDVHDVFTPTITATRATDGPTTAVQIGKTHVYASVGNRIIAVHRDTKQIDAIQMLDGDIADLALDGDVLLALGTNGTLTALRVQGADLTILSSLPLNLPANELYLDRGTAYLAIHDGLATVDYRDPANLLLLSGPDRAAGLTSNPSSYALTGSGLGVYVSQEFPLGTYALDMLNANDPLDTYDFLVRFLLPDRPQALAISHGYAFIASEESGLQVVNFQSLDTEGTPPQVTMQATVSDEDPAKVGVQVGPGRVIRIDGRVVDDFLVRSVELWVNNVLVEVDTSYPWTFTYDTGYSLIAQERVLELRARDTGENEGKSVPLVLDYVPDLSAPVLTSSSPLPGQPVLNVSRIDLNFDEALDPSKIAMSGVQLTELGLDGLVGGGDDRTIPIAQLQLTQSDRTLTALLDPLEPGSYRWLVSVGTVADLSGNQIAQPIDLRFSIPRGNRVQAASGFPADPTLPSANPGQEISFVMNFGPEMARLELQGIDNNGVKGVMQLSPSHTHAPTKTAYFTIPEGAYTGMATLYGYGSDEISSLPKWNTSLDAVNLLGTGATGKSYRDILPNNGLYAELGSTRTPTEFSLQSKDEFTLTPGSYELSMDLAGADASFLESMHVTLGTVFNETFSRPSRSPFSRQTRTIVVNEATTGRLTLTHLGSRSKGLIVDDVLLKRIDDGTVLIQDAFDLPITDPTFTLQIVPVVREVDVTNYSTNNVAFAIRGDGIIEGENTQYRFGSYFLTDTSASSGPDVRNGASTGPTEINQYVTLSVPNSNALFGDVSIETAGGRSAPYRVRLDSVPTQAMSGTATDPILSSANAGQSIDIVGEKLSLTTELVVEYLDESGRPFTQLVNPTWASTDRKRAQLILPASVTGVTSLRAFGSPSVIPIQIVPLVLRTNTESGPNNTIMTRFVGRGFFEGNSVYDFGGFQVEDVSADSMPDVQTQNQSALVSAVANQVVDLIVTTAGGSSYPVSSQNVDWLEIPIELTGIESPPVNGVPANLQLGAGNAGQVITLIGSGFSLDAMQVIFPTRNENGVDGMEAIAPLAVNGPGTRAQVRVPEYTMTGPIRVTRIGNRNIGIESGIDTIHRRIRVEFTPMSSTTLLRFSDGGLSGASEESWGLDNVRVLQGSSTIYSTDFEQSVGPEWSLPNSVELNGYSKVSGPFSNRVLSLSLSGLTPGQTHTLEWDLWVFDTWEGLQRTDSADRFLVMADQTVLFNESFSNNLLSTQTYSPGIGVTLQVVPTITGTNSNEYTGLGRGGFWLYGSGYVEGQGAITVGGRTIIDRQFSVGNSVRLTGSVTDPDVIVNPEFEKQRPNSVYRVHLSSTQDEYVVDGPIRVTTNGGYFEIPEPFWTLIRPGRLDRIESTALRGTPADPSRPSANTGQDLILSGSFMSWQLVEFDAMDDTGYVGHVVRNSRQVSNGLHNRTFELPVPVLARTGQVRLMDTNEYFDLQVVPTLRGISTLSVGQTAILEGTGISPGDSTISIDGIVIPSFTVLTNRRIADRQFVSFIVPAGIGQGRVEVSTPGGRAVLQTNAAAVASATVQPPTDVGDTREAAYPLQTKVDDRFTLMSSIEPRLAPSIDEDYYRMELVAGDFIVLDLDSDTTTGDQNMAMEIQNSLGEWFLESGTEANARIHFQVPSTGVYFLRVYDVEENDSVDNYRVHVRRMSPSSTTLSRIVSTSNTGTPAQSHLPSANEGQSITLLGNGFQPGEKVVFQYGDTKYEIVEATSVAADGKSMVVQLPVSRDSSRATTGMIRLETEDVGLFLQVVPKLVEIQILSQNPPSLRSTYLHGDAFDEPGTIYVGSDRYTADLCCSSEYDLDLAANSPMGPIRVETFGGSSQLLKAPDLVTIPSVAASGTPANPNLPSANPSQTITIVGNKLSKLVNNVSYSTPLFMPVIDIAGTISEVIVHPTTVSDDGTQMTIVVPRNAVTGKVGILGDPEGTLITLQIVPVVSSVLIQTSNVQVSGSGLIEGNGLYRFGDLEILDGSISGGGVDVSNSVNGRNDRANVRITPPSSGIMTVTTAGGTSAPVSFGALNAAATPSEDRRPDTLEIDQLAPLVDEVLRRYRTGELSTFPEWTPTMEARLERLQWQIIELPGTTLGYGSGDTISIDPTAAGWGWFIDPTPWDDLEFETEGDQGEQELNDLLTVLAHELGHVLGLDHEREGLMAETLATGERKLD